MNIAFTQGFEIRACPRQLSDPAQRHPRHVHQLQRLQPRAEGGRGLVVGGAPRPADHDQVPEAAKALQVGQVSGQAVAKSGADRQSYGEKSFIFNNQLKVRCTKLED